MLLLLFFLSFSSDVCQSQMIYSRLLPYDPRYVLQRPPVRRSAMEALERLRMPVTRYFPQVDTQVASLPYEPSVAAPMSGYQVPVEDTYAMQPQWNDDFIQAFPPERTDDDGDYGNYEYEGSFQPVYRVGPFAEQFNARGQEPVAEPEPIDNSNLYNDFMVNYFLGAENENRDPQTEQFELQRRSENQNQASNNQGVITLNSVVESNKNVSNSPNAAGTLTPPASVPSQTPPQVQMTAVPSAPEKKEIKSLVIPEPEVEARAERDESWRAMGQKEEPLFRPLQNSQRTTWEVLTRAKDSVQKRPIPLLKKMIQSSQQPKTVIDPLTEELQNLKKENV